MSKYENALVTPNGDSIKTLADVLSVNPDYFFSRQVDNKTLEKLSFRHDYLIDPNGELINKIKMLALEKISNYLLLERLADEKTVFINPLEGFQVKTKKDARRAAQTLRRRWKLGEAPVRNVVDTLECNGIKIIELECPANFNGLSGEISGETTKIPVIVINISVSEKTRRRFTILHELGHIVMDLRDIGHDDVENLCNVFAGAVLLPEEILLCEFSNRNKISLAELFNLKKRYGISVQAILFMAADIDVMSWREYHKWKEDSFDHPNVEYDVEEKSERLFRLIDKCISKEVISIEKAAALASMRVPDLHGKLQNFIDLR